MRDLSDAYVMCMKQRCWNSKIYIFWVPLHYCACAFLAAPGCQDKSHAIAWISFRHMRIKNFTICSSLFAHMNGNYLIANSFFAADNPGRLLTYTTIKKQIIIAADNPGRVAPSAQACLCQLLDTVNLLRKCAEGSHRWGDYGDCETGIHLGFNVRDGRIQFEVRCEGGKIIIVEPAEKVR